MATQQTETSDSVHALEVQLARIERSIDALTTSYTVKFEELKLRRNSIQRNIVALKEAELETLKQNLPA